MNPLIAVPLAGLLAAAAQEDAAARLHGKPISLAEGTGRVVSRPGAGRWALLVTLASALGRRSRHSSR